MKRILAYAITIAAGFMPIDSSAETLIYKCTMLLDIPRVYDNTQSLGYRKPQRQQIVGYITVDTDISGRSEEEDKIFGYGEPAICALGFTNNTHKISTGKVTYEDACAQEVMWRYIGNNKTGVFRRTNVEFKLDLNPSYNIGEDEPDNTLIITLSGDGATYKQISGTVTGHIGCGCADYGHTSPTRTIDFRVDDKAPLDGRFAMRLVRTAK